MGGFALIRRKTTSKALIKRDVEIGSHCLVPYSNLKHGVALPPLITNDPRFLTNICIHFQNSLPNPNFFNTLTSRQNH